MVGLQTPCLSLEWSQRFPSKFRAPTHQWYGRLPAVPVALICQIRYHSTHTGLHYIITGIVIMAMIRQTVLAHCSTGSLRRMILSWWHTRFNGHPPSVLGLAWMILSGNSGSLTLVGILGCHSESELSSLCSLTWMPRIIWKIYIWDSALIPVWPVRLCVYAFMRCVYAFMRGAYIYIYILMMYIYIYILYDIYTMIYTLDSCSW
jgi:hypothetical protein